MKRIILLIMSAVCLAILATLLVSPGAAQQAKPTSTPQHGHKPPSSPWCKWSRLRSSRWW